MRVLKVVAEGITTSFRYPDFMLQIHPTFEMPPPATIYGHIASALGEWFEPEGVRFAYHFTFSGKVSDKEHVILATPASGYIKDTKFPKVLEGNVNPFDRALLFQPRLTLYINRPEWEDAFRSPHYPVVLGRSQDLFTYTKIEVIELEQASHAYFEHTLLPYSTTQYTSRGYAVRMPRYLDYNNKRRPTFSRYFIVRDRLDSRVDFLWFGEKKEERYWIDPYSPEYKGAHLGLVFLSFVGDENETITIS
ncbi:MAG: type I-B CRISPR-associated protein Cas5b [Anaerolineales bacterium]